MKTYLEILCLCFILVSCGGQSANKAESYVGGPCEDCEALLDYEKINPTPKSTDTIPGFSENNPKIKITGTVFHKDGKTPAENVILYVYHVNRNGLYQPDDNPIGWEHRHGQHRNWLKTGADGKFVFYTFRPVSYPESQEPQHIHIYLKEPGTIPYYIDSYLFDDDPLLTSDKRSSQKNRGGSGIIKLEMKDDIWTARRDLILGLNIPEYE